MKLRTTLILAGCIIILQVLALPSWSCVGRILTISVNDTLEQKVVGRLLATYITERTGTTVNMITGLDIKASEEQIKQCKADIFINYLNVGLSTMEQGDSGKNAQETYGLVKHYYGEKFNMVWLKPLGYKGPLLKDTDKAAENASLAIPVTTRDVLNRFPVLDRVINKLGGRLDKNTLQQLILETETKDVAVVVKDFLKNQNLI
jgi:glycine betaine/choline ABC-type transport system substrate-binding protein